MSQPQLFVLVSTKQNVANLPPVLEYARRGDLVLWVESPDARKEKWAAGAKKVLADEGLTEAEEPVAVDEINAPAEVARACRAAVERRRPRADVILVANGGKKLTPAGLLEACRGSSPTVLYGDDRAELWVFEGGLDRPPRKQIYRRHRLDLEAILAASASGHVFFDRTEVRCVWPSPLPDDLGQESYARDAQATRDLHAAHSEWAARGSDDGSAHVPFEQLAALLPKEVLARWHHLLNELARPGGADNPALPKEIYGATLNLMRRAAKARGRVGVAAPTKALGDSLERAVLRRAAGWAGECGRSVVQSVWGNVRVARPSQPTAVVAQFDVLLVLKNGILLHLECKSARSGERKDLDARLLNLQQAGSLLAKMAVCVPLYTAFAGEDWFLDLHRLRERAEGWGLRVVPMTLEGQPAEYAVSAPDGTSVTRPCPSFEEALEKLVSPYFPSPDCATDD